MANPRISFIGAGNMAASIIGGMVAGGFDAADICAADPQSDTLRRLAAELPITTTGDNARAAASADVLVLAVKPQMIQQVASALADTVQQHRPLVVSIAAGVRADSLERWLGGELAVVRCMPNTPALVRRGATALYANARVDNNQRALADRIMAAVGSVLWVEEENLLDAVTAVSGSGPAYFFLVMEALQAAGENLGLDAETARALTLQTALGAAEMALASDADVTELRRRVSSPGGTTERAIARLEEAGLRDIFREAVTAACERSRELAADMDQA